MALMLSSNKPLSSLTKSKQINYWEDLIEHIKRLPYGRNSNRSNLGLVILEAKGTCSSKHAFLKAVADENNIPSIKLILAIYKMNGNNTPNVQRILQQFELTYLPEAHCFLQINNCFLDVTTPQSNYNQIKNGILFQMEIEAEQIIDFKPAFHKNYLQNWLVEENIKLSYNRVWEIRELCIKSMEKQKSLN